eukprot:Skav213294  [mRNA]  locus=scaffold2480:289190:293146:- [translate_table: standard]
MAVSCPHRGFYGFLFAGGLFWLVRICACGLFCVQNIKIPTRLGAQSERPSNKVRFQRGASKMLGRGGSKGITPEVVPGKVVEERRNGSWW